MAAKENWIKVAGVNEVPSMSLKHIEVEGKEIALINLDGNYFAVSDRCGHMNTSLSLGKLEDVQGKSIVRCPLHGSTFDVKTGKNVSGPVKPPPSDLSCLAQAVRDQFIRAAQVSAMIKVYDLEHYDVQTDGDEIKLNIPV